MADVTGMLTPVYADKAGNRLIVCAANFFADSECGVGEVRAREFQYTVLAGLTATPEVLAADGEIPHFRCKYGVYNVALISGPEYERLRVLEEATTPAPGAGGHDG